MHNKKTGFISIIGRPSSGKSTLINKICNDKISIVSKHPQTTRFIIKGIYNDDDSQIVFLDTPGFHHFDSILNRSLSNLAIRNLDDGDLILYIVDLSRDLGEEENAIINYVSQYSDKLIVAFNKIDLVEKQNISLLSKIQKRLSALQYCVISAKNGENIDLLIKALKDNLKEGPLYYPDDYVTDQSIPFRIEEIVREKVFQLTSEEIPHSVYVKVVDLIENKNKIKATAKIFVEKNSQKGILVGKGGSMIKKIGILARKELEKIFDTQVNLFLSIIVDHKWKNNKTLLKKMFKL